MGKRKQPKRMVICLDFDGTVVTHRYPMIGMDIGALPWLRIVQKMGALIVLFTMRDGAELEAARNYLVDNGIQLYGINANPSQTEWTSSPKAYGHVYIDDNGIGIPLSCGDGKPYVDWGKVGPMLVERVAEWIIRHDTMAAL